MILTGREPSTQCIDNTKESAMNFGKQMNMQAKAKMIEDRLGMTAGASKGSRPAPPAKVKPILGKDKVGVKVTKKF